MVDVADIDYQDEFITVKGSMTISEVAKEIAKAGVPDAVVIDDKDKVLGALDDYDIVSKCLAEDHDPKTMKAEDIMYAPPPVKLTSDLNEVHETMQKLEATMLPVVDDENNLLGVVTIMDVLEGLNQEHQQKGFFAKLFGR